MTVRLTAVFTFAALKMLGIASPTLLCIPVFPAVMLKGCSVVLLWYGASSGELGMKAPKQITTALALRDLGGDILLLLYSAIGYTTLWEANPFFSASAWGSFFFQSFFPGTAWGGQLFALLYFLSVYIMVRSIYLLQDFVLEDSWTVRLWALLSFVLVSVTAMLSVPQR